MDIIAALTETRDRTLACYDRPSIELDRTYAPGKWTARQLLHHLADAETVLHDRVRRVISEPRGVIWAFDQDAWCRELDYAGRDLTINRDLYAATRASVIYLAGRFYASHGDREFVHSEVGVRTLQMEFDKIAKHNAHHLDQIARAQA